MLDLAAPLHRKTVFDDSALVAGAVHDRSPVRLRPGDNHYRFIGKVGHDTAVATQGLAVRAEQRYAMTAGLVLRKRGHRRQVQRSKIGEHQRILSEWADAQF